LEEISRAIGLPRHFKGYSKVLSCQAAGVTEFMLQKRDAPALFKSVRETPPVPLYQWKIDSGKIVGGALYEGIEEPKQHH
jgi:hypothetical protein